MSGSAAWIVGQGGFLGSRLRRRLPAGVRAWDPPAFSWLDPEALAVQLEDAARRFAEAAREAGGPWYVLWCAGAGGVGTPPARLRTETVALERLLPLLPADLPGRFLLSSSAGGVWGDGRDLPLTEDSPCSPISEYGRNKLLQEERVARWAGSRPEVSCLIARLSNLYGPTRGLARPQGLLARLALGILEHRPTHIYVPLDSLRDYLYIDDAAAHLARCLERLGSPDAPPVMTKIFASGRSTSVGAILGIFSRIVRRRPLVVCTAHPLHREQPGRLAFRSVRWTDLPPPRLTPLPEGIHALFRDHLSLFQRNLLPAPAP